LPRRLLGSAEIASAAAADQGLRGLVAVVLIDLAAKPAAGTREPRRGCLRVRSRT